MFICDILLYFLNSAHLICRSTDISKCFNGSLRLRDNESRLYLLFGKTNLSNDENTLLFRAVYRYIKIQRGLYRQPYTKVHTVREQNGGSQSLLDRSSFSFISPLFSFSSLSFFFSFFVGIFVTYTFFVHAQRAKSGLHADALQKFHRH